MDAVSAFFMQNIVYVYFFYGLAFFAMGLVVQLESGRATEFRFARALRPLALFGFLHGAHEWFEMFQIFAAHDTGHAAGTAEEMVRIIILALSFACLLDFGARLLPDAESRPRAHIGQVALMAGLWLGGVAFLYLRHRPGPSDILVAADVLSRYGLGIPGALLAAWALLRERRDFHARGMSQYGRDLLWAALAFFVFGAVGQLFTRPSMVFPSQVVNTAFFLRTFGVPVQLLRGLAAIAIAITLGRALRAFELESRLRLGWANKARLEAQAATLEAQQHRTQEVEALNIQLQATARELSSMVELSRILTSTLALNPLLHDALDQVVHSFRQACTSMVFLKTPDGGLELAGEYRCTGIPEPDSDSSWRQAADLAVTTGQPACAGPVVRPQAQSSALRADAAPAQGLPADSEVKPAYRTLAVPLRAKGATLGGLVLSSLQEDVGLGRDDLDLLSAFGQQVATAIENARLYQVVQAREAQLEAMVRQLVTAQERERKRISQELHDETGQKLTALAMGLAAVETHLTSGDAERVPYLVHDLRDLADQSITELRHVMADLRPSQLDDLGLIPALRWYVQQYSTRYPELSVSFSADRLPSRPGIAPGSAGRLPPQHEIILFRVVQEALNNVARHACASEVRVSLGQAPGAVWLEVADNGVGFDMNTPARHEEGSGLGLPGMRERVALVNGALTIESRPGQGTRIRVELPLKA